MEMETGKLYLIPTPIGNLGDITLRALEVLKTCDILFAEDTRTTGILLKHFQIKTNLRSFHAHNEHEKTEQIKQLIEEGKTIGLVSDAGSPGISDPGFLATGICAEHNLPFEALPGATAFVPALLESGFPCDKFVFEGFLPQKKGRQTRWEALAQEKRTIILYESPYRVVKLLEEIKKYLGGERRVSASREISKKFHQTLRGTCDEIYSHFKKTTPKGEFVVVIEGKNEK